MQVPSQVYPLLNEEILNLCGRMIRNDLNGAKRWNDWNDWNGPRCRNWLELLGESGLFPDERLAPIKKETGELKGIFVSIVRNIKTKSQTPKR